MTVTGIISRECPYAHENSVYYPTCKCGWEGVPVLMKTEARKRHAAHVRDDCPIGKH
jgi:hypothetical protein